MYKDEAAPAMVQPRLFYQKPEEQEESPRNRQIRNYSGRCLLARDSIRCAPQGRVFKNSHQNLLKKVSILSAFRLLIFNTFKVKIVL